MVYFPDTILAFLYGRDYLTIFHLSNFCFCFVSMQLSFYYVAAAILLYASLIFCLFNFNCYFENFYCSFLIMAFF